MKHYEVELEVPAGIGENSVLKRRSGYPLQVEKLHLDFEGWMGNDIMETSPVFYITEKLRFGLEKSELSGISHFENIEVTKSENFEELYPNKKLPSFFLFRINGQARQDDFGVESGKLIVSGKALEFLKNFNLSEAEINEL